MSNPTELPDLLPCPFCGGAARFERTGNWHDLFVAHVGDCYLSGEGAEMSYLDSTDVQKRMASKWNCRAQPEGEAPQADPICKVCGADVALNGETCGVCFWKPAATLSPLCGAQHAESGKEAVVFASEGTEPDWSSYAAAEAVQQAAAPRTDLSKRIRAAATADVTLAQAKLLIGAAEEIERAQQAAAPGALDADEMTRLRRLMRAIGWDHERDESDKIVRGTLFAVLGQAAGELERANSAPGTPEAPKPPFPISDDEMAALRRFWECATDGEGYDVEKPMMQRLAEMGLVQRKSGAYYMATEFGLYVLGEYTVERAAQLDDGQEGSAT